MRLYNNDKKTVFLKKSFGSCPFTLQVGVFLSLVQGPSTGIIIAWGVLTMQIVGLTLNCCLWVSKSEDQETTAFLTTAPGDS